MHFRLADAGGHLVLTVTMVCLFSCFEAIKQCANYGVRYYNDGNYPIPQTMVVCTLEVLKLIITVIRSGGELENL